MVARRSWCCAPPSPTPVIHPVHPEVPKIGDHGVGAGRRWVRWALDTLGNRARRGSREAASRLESLPGSMGSKPSGHAAGPTALGSRSATSLPSGPRILMLRPSPHPQPLQCHTRVLPALVTRPRTVIGADGPPTSGVAVSANLTSVTAGRVGSFPQPDSRNTAAIARERKKRRIFEPKDTTRPSRRAQERTT